MSRNGKGTESNAAAQERARAALQALLRRNSEVKRGAEAVSGSPLTQLLRAEIAEVLCKPSHVKRVRDVEGQVSKFLDRVSSEPAATTAFQPPARVRECQPWCEKSIQTETEATTSATEPRRRTSVVPEELMALIEKTPITERERPLPRLRRALTLPDDKEGHMRRQVNDAQRKLAALDSEVTTLTRDLKRQRIKTWEQQRELSSCEAQIQQILAKRLQELRPEARAEEAELEQEERRLAAELTKVRPQAGHWYTRASHQDRELQQTEQERRCGGNAPCWIRGLVKSHFYTHPSGDVFLVDSDSDEEVKPGGAAGRGRNGGAVGRGANRGREEYSSPDNVSDDSYSSEDNPPPRGGGRPLAGATVTAAEKDKAPPPPPTQSFRAFLDDDDDDSIEGGSSMPSPSADSTSSPQGTSEVKSPSGSSGLLPCVDVQEQRPAQGNLQAVSDGKSRLGKGPRGGSDYSSSDDEVPSLPLQNKLTHSGNALSMAALAGKTFDQLGRTGAPPAAVPSVPEIAGAANRGRTIMREDEAAEVSSEEIEDLDTSRSA